MIVRVEVDGGQVTPPSLVVYVSETSTERDIRRLRTLGWGRMWNTKNVQKWDPGEPVGLDNGAFGAWRAGKRFPTERFLRRIDSAIRRGITPDLAVVPDIVAGGLESLEFSLHWLHSGKLPGSWPWYLAVQNGILGEDLEGYSLENIAGVFLGGDDTYKTTASYWRGWTQGRGLKFHYGRCSTIRRVEAALQLGVDSLDSLILNPFRWWRGVSSYAVELLVGRATPHPKLWEL